MSLAEAVRVSTEERARLKEALARDQACLHAALQREASLESRLQAAEEENDELEAALTRLEAIAQEQRKRADAAEAALRRERNAAVARIALQEADAAFSQRTAGAPPAPGAPAEYMPTVQLQSAAAEEKEEAAAAAAARAREAEIAAAGAAVRRRMAGAGARRLAERGGAADAFSGLVTAAAAAVVQQVPFAAGLSQAGSGAGAQPRAMPIGAGRFSRRSASLGSLSQAYSSEAGLLALPPIPPSPPPSWQTF